MLARSWFSRSVAAAFLLVSSATGDSSTALLAQTASRQEGSTIHVSNERELRLAVASLGPDTTIILAPGTYSLTSPIAIRGPLSNVGLRGATTNPDDVVLVGRGMSNARADAVVHGISVSGNVRGLTVANLTIRDVSQHALVLGPGASRPHIYNVRFLDTGAEPINAGSGVDDGRVEQSTFGYTTSATRAGISAIEVVSGRGWIIQKNLFRNIKGPGAQLGGPAVLLWQGSSESVVEGNTFINCQREIAFGMEPRSGHDHSGGSIRNNFIYRESSVAGDTAIQVVDSPGTEVLHNTVLSSGTAASTIEYRSATNPRVAIRNNLLDAPITGRDGGNAVVESNFTSATPDMFVSPATGDLHLTSGAVSVLDAAPVLPGAGPDWDGDPRPRGRAADYGADEAGAENSSSGSARSQTTRSTAPGSRTSTLQATTASVGAAALPAPWQLANVGNPLLQGFAAYADGYFAVQGTGSDIGGQSDQFTFVYQTLDGDGEIVARIETLDRTNPGAKAGVMFRDELTATAKHAFALITPGQGLAFQRRLEDGATAAQSGGGQEQAPHWVKLKRTGSTFSASSSRDGVSWTSMGSATISINRLAYVGLAVTSQSDRSMTNALFSSVKVMPNAPAPNEPPRVAITSPATGASYTAPATVSVAAQASDSDGSVTRVNFYAGSTLIGSDSTNPFSVTWNNVPAGRHALKAVAEDNAGAFTPSAIVEINVAGNQPPSVTLTAPAPNTSFTAPASVTMTASAVDSDGTIARVEFYAGSTLVGTDTSSPYSVTWSNAPAGSYTLSAKAWDNAGGSMISGGVNVTIAGANQRPTVSLTSPAAGASFLAPATITLAATASDPDGTVAWVDFYAGSTLVGSDPSSPYSFTWTNVPAGSYALTAVARDNGGGSSTSSPVSITVTTTTTSLPRFLVFTASVDHAVVVSYTVEVFQAGADPSRTAPFRTLNIGKPAPVNGEITVDVAALVQALPTGSYFFAVTATSAAGSSRSAPSEVFTR